MSPDARTASRPRRERPRGLTQAERSSSTIQELLATARELFAAKGFAETSIEDMVRSAGVTRGALYHHFENKTDVFRAVVEDEERRLQEALVAAAEKKRDPWQQVEAGCLAFLDACTDPALQQLLLVDAPAVLGWDELREMAARYTRAVLRYGLESAMAAGKLRRRDPEPLASILFGAMCELGMTAARAEDTEAAVRAARRELQALLRAIATS